MIWADDKQKHYKYCFEHTKKAPLLLCPIWGLCVFVGVSAWKELYHDWYKKLGTPDWQDVHANLIGVVDAILNKNSRF